MAAAGALEMTGGQRAELERLDHSHSAPAREVRQAKALLWATDGVSNAEIARRCASTPKSVRRWRSRFAAEGTAAVGRIRAGRGRPVVLGDDVVEAIVHDTLHTVPEDGSACWSTRSMAARYGIGKDTVARIWQARRIRPWKVETFKLSTDPSFESKLRDVVGLYVNPPAAAAVFCFDYNRSGTLDLFAALSVGSGEVLHDTAGRQELLHECQHRPTRASLSVTGWPTRNAAAGTCTSPRPARHGSTSSSAGSPCSAAKP